MKKKEKSRFKKKELKRTKEMEAEMLRPQLATAATVVERRQLEELKEECASLRDRIARYSAMEQELAALREKAAACDEPQLAVLRDKAARYDLLAPDLSALLACVAFTRQQGDTVNGTGVGEPAKNGSLHNGRIAELEEEVAALKTALAERAQGNSLRSSAPIMSRYQQRALERFKKEVISLRYKAGRYDELKGDLARLRWKAARYDDLTTKRGLGRSPTRPPGRPRPSS